MDINPIRPNDYWVLNKNPFRPIWPKKNIPKFNPTLPIKKNKKQKKLAQKNKNECKHRWFDSHQFQFSTVDLHLRSSPPKSDLNDVKLAMLAWWSNLSPFNSALPFSFFLVYCWKSWIGYGNECKASWLMCLDSPI